MPGFPNRIRRTSLGPVRQDVWPVTNPAKAVSATVFNLEHWQLAGCNLTAARGLVEVTMSGTTPNTTAQGLAWDPDGALPLLGWTRISTGVYEYEFPQSQYPDEDGNLVTLALQGALPVPQSPGASSGGAMLAWHQKLGPRKGRIWTFQIGASVAVDDVEDGGTFLVWFV